LERGAVCGGNGALRSESAGSWTALDAFCTDELDHSSLMFFLTHNPHPSSTNHPLICAQFGAPSARSTAKSLSVLQYN
jgi:hypothetical protein